MRFIKKHETRKPPRSYRPSDGDLVAGSPARDSMARPKKKHKKSRNKTYCKNGPTNGSIPPGSMVLFCDGCCLTNPGRGGWAFANCGNGDRCFGGIEHGTNNIAELTGAIESLKYASRLQQEGVGGSVFVFSDSQYVVRGVMEWAVKWERDGWSRKEGGLKNLDLWKDLVELKKKTGPVFRWVKGHNGNHWNELVDSLASEGATRQIRKFLPGRTAVIPENCEHLPGCGAVDFVFV